MNKKTVVVIGASSGIGYQIAVHSAQSGYRVVWCSRNIEHRDDLPVDADSAKVNIDVREESSVKACFEKIIKLYGKIDVVVNCAGYVEPDSLMTTSLENWNRTITTNLTGVFLCCKYAAREMKNYGGKIINIASTSGVTPRPGWSAYAASKSGVINFSITIAEELSAYNIKIYILCPGRTATPLRKILAPEEDPKSIMQPSAVAKTAVYCMSDDANVIEGQPILVRERF